MHPWPFHVTLIPGDGIGPEITDATVRILDAAGAKITWDRQLAGMAAVGAQGTPIPDATLESIARTKLALKGPLETPVGGGYRSCECRAPPPLRSLREPPPFARASSRAAASKTSTSSSSARTRKGSTAASSTT